MQPQPERAVCICACLYTAIYDAGSRLDRQDRFSDRRYQRYRQVHPAATRALRIAVTICQQHTDARRETAFALAESGATVVLGCRNIDGAREIAAEIRCFSCF